MLKKELPHHHEEETENSRIQEQLSKIDNFQTVAEIFKQLGDTTRIRISTFAIAGLLAGLSGFLMTSRVTIGQPNAAESYEMDAITACVVGGVSMSGGVGKPWGVVVGCLLITVIANGLDIMGVSSHWQKIVKGAIIVLAVLLDIKGKGKKN